MKSIWLTCTILCLGSMAGCSSATSATSTADQPEETSVSSPVVEAEWAKDELTTPDLTVAMKVQPIPDAVDDATATDDDEASPVIKLIPDDAN